MDAILETATDSGDYEVLINACKKASSVPGLSCEIGVRAGGSSYYIMKTFLEMNAKRPHIAIDPYGNINYIHWETQVVKMDYTNPMKYETMQNLYAWCLK